MRHNDVVLAACIAGSMSAGVLLPSAGLLVEPYILVWLGALLFLNLIRLKTSDLLATFTKPRQLAVLSAVKLAALPVGMYALVYFVYQPFALPVLLLSGISTGLGAPFVVNLIGGRLPLIVGMIIATSLAVPFVLPSIVYALVGSQFDIPVIDMVFLLSAALFTPLAAGWFTKKRFPVASRFVDEKSFPLSLVFIVLINFGMFAKFSSYFYEEQVFLLQTIATAFICYAAYSLVGYASAPGGQQERSAGLIAMSYVNNVLVAVFAFQFFGSQVAALAALYNIPYYVGIVAIKRFMPGQ
ncbi:arsenical resistance-3 family protein [Candidatus Nitrososphaera gargensis Ga9.2]|uniref:Arsenical resistance-3 family protein n=1 Tax=Nitrososphaera gargensis (strain Ga9.2) TaxID=1237085 RepID=K0IE33_NITGG|nr:arsenic resistance protein [Candidatus Nitrososphaera gargensis]AFU57078.1 arsenical resistance-3 family protein [Candidatus Nitrososphaera gargensis Ga9.2]